MNDLVAKSTRVPYLKESVLCAFVDGVRLDVLVMGMSNEKFMDGYVPSWYDNLFILEDFREIWRLSLQLKTNTILPVLICPEERDLSFKPVVTQLKIKDDVVMWDGFGRMIQFEDGFEVSWFSDEVLHFKKVDYIKMLRLFCDVIQNSDDSMMKKILAKELEENALLG